MHAGAVAEVQAFPHPAFGVTAAADAYWRAVHFQFGGLWLPRGNSELDAIAAPVAFDLIAAVARTCLTRDLDLILETCLGFQAGSISARNAAEDRTARLGWWAPEVGFGLRFPSFLAAWTRAALVFPLSTRELTSASGRNAYKLPEVSAQLAVGVAWPGR